jgi:spore coat polysaccharide biosynthesis protein SpsF
MDRNNVADLNGMLTVRSSSTRLPEKCFLPFGEGTVIEHVIRRAKHFGFNPIVCTTIEPEDERLVEIAKKENVRYFQGSVRDKLVRWRDACRKFKVKKFISIDADDLFFDPDMAHLSLQTLDKGYDLVTHYTQEPYIGCVGYSLTADIIERACDIKKSDDTEMMWHFIEKVPGIKKAELSVNKEALGNIRLTLDYQEDYWLFCAVLRILGPFATAGSIVELFRHNPDLHKINWFRNQQYQANIENKSRHIVNSTDYAKDTHI